MNNSSKSKKIAKNTIALYVRMVIVTLVGLYTSRVILKGLGIDDFGLYNVVGGVVSLFAFFRSSMERCTQRFLNVEMVKENGKTHDVFGNAIIIHLGLALIALILAETIGLWFLNQYILIPEGREIAANCVYQTVIFGLLLTILTVPYSATIIANERMGVFAIIGVLDCILNLGIAFLISISSYDRLILYGILILLIRIVNFLFHVLYCRMKCKEVQGKIRYKKDIVKEMLGYTSWTLVGHAMILGTNQGNSILVNMFHGVSANAAMAVANQVNGHVLSLTSNFQTAFNPQITKAYAKNDYSYLHRLIISTSKISYFLLFIVSLPLLLNIDFILEIWLETVPTDANIFCALMLSSGILQATTSPLNFSIMATGEIKWFQITTGLVFLSDLIVLYSLFSVGFSAPTAMWVKLSIMVIVTIVRIIFAKHQLPKFSIMSYIKEVIFPLSIVTIISVTCGMLFMQRVSTVISRFLISLLIIFLTALVIIVIGVTTNERKMVTNLIRRR